MILPFTKPVPMRQKEIDPVPLWELHRLQRQAAILKAAEAGDAKAIKELRERGLKRWEKQGRRII